MGRRRGYIRIQGYAAAEIRERSGIKQCAIADAAEIGRAYLSKIEGGRAEWVSVDVYRRILAALRIGDWRVLLADPHHVTATDLELLDAESDDSASAA